MWVFMHGFFSPIVQTILLFFIKIQVYISRVFIILFQLYKLWFMLWLYLKYIWNCYKLHELRGLWVNYSTCYLGFMKLCMSSLNFDSIILIWHDYAQIYLNHMILSLLIMSLYFCPNLHLKSWLWNLKCSSKLIKNG